MTRLSSLRSRIEDIVLVLVCIFIALTPISSKAINLAWIFIVGFALWLLVSRAYQTDITSNFLNLRWALFVLVGFFVLGLCLKIGMMLYWGESIRDVSFELSAAVAAAIALGIVCCWQARPDHMTMLAGVFSVAAILALIQGYGYMFKHHPGPTNAVNWGAGIGLFMCLALAITAHQEARFRDKTFSMVALIFFSMAIFVAGRRGVFFAIIWAMVVGSYFGFRNVFWSKAVAIRVILPVVVLVGAIGVSLFSSDRLSAPVDRVVEAMNEVSQIIDREEDSGDHLRGSLHARFHLLELGVDAASASPLVGLGAEARALLIKRAESDMKAPLFHMHNEYMQAWVAYGIPGLLGALCFPIGLVMAGLLIRRKARALGLALTGMGLVHFVSSLSNVNTFHNYYSTVFAVCVVLPFLLLPLSAQPEKIKSAVRL